MTGHLIDDATLLASPVVANSAMNRERQLAGANSYTRELGFNPLEWLTARLDQDTPGATGVAWLDLCCGTGRALIQAAECLAATGLDGRVALVGVDLVDYFDPIERPGRGPLLVCSPVSDWRAPRLFDLITCVHGLHYVGDKLGVLVRAASWLTDTGRLVADLDLASIHLPSGQPAGRRLVTALRAAGFTYDPRRRRVGRTGRGAEPVPYTYLGADDRAGPNYTGQPAVTSVYAERE